VFCGLLVLLFLFSWNVVGQNLTPPTLIWKNDFQLPTVSVTNMNTDDINVAIATDLQGNVYTLTFP